MMAARPGGRSGLARECVGDQIVFAANPFLREAGRKANRQAWAAAAICSEK